MSTRACSGAGMLPANLTLLKRTNFEVSALHGSVKFGGRRALSGRVCLPCRCGTSVRATVPRCRRTPPPTAATWWLRAATLYSRSWRPRRSSHVPSFDAWRKLRSSTGRPCWPCWNRSSGRRSLVPAPVAVQPYRPWAERVQQRETEREAEKRDDGACCLFPSNNSPPHRPPGGRAARGTTS
jgi:hypothetical protein